MLRKSIDSDDSDEEVYRKKSSENIMSDLETLVHQTENLLFSLDKEHITKNTEEAI